LFPLLENTFFRTATHLHASVHILVDRDLRNAHALLELHGEPGG
jgi:hypothetical protein